MEANPQATAPPPRANGRPPAGARPRTGEGQGGGGLVRGLWARRGFGAGRRGRNGRGHTIARPVAQFAISGLLAVVLLGAIAVRLLRDTGTSEAIRNAKEVTRLAGEGIVVPDITPGVLTAQRASLRRLDEIVRARILNPPVVRVKIWNAQGQILYSDEPRLIGARYPLPAEEREALQTGGTQAEVSLLARPENHFERAWHQKLLEVYHGIRAPTGQRLLFESYQSFGSIAASGQRLWLRFAPALIGALVLLELAQIPLAASLARRIRRGQQEREALLRRAIDASAVERKRIARDLHDGVVQNLIGVSYRLAAADESTNGHSGNGVLTREVGQAAAETRRSIRELRTLLVDIYPPDLHRAGLAAALSDLTAPLAGGHIDARLDVEPGLALPAHAEALLFRAVQEGLRNVLAHARASRVAVSVTADARRATLTVEDDGRGFDSSAPSAARDHRHFGLRILDDLARDANGKLIVDSAPGRGTRLSVEVPLA